MCIFCTYGEKKNPFLLIILKKNLPWGWFCDSKGVPLGPDSYDFRYRLTRIKDLLPDDISTSDED